MPHSSMPTILAIDSSTEVCSVALSHSGEIQEKTVLAAREHTERLLPMVDSLLAESGITLKQLDGIAVGIGPGSFTGLRIGLSNAQGLAYGLDCPIVDVSSLAAMANRVGRDAKPFSANKVVIPAIDARMNEIYWSAYELSPSLTMTELSKEVVSSPKDCFIYSSQHQEKDIVGVGSGWGYRDDMDKTVNHIDTEFYATAYDILELAIPAFNRGEAKEAALVQPRYLRNEITWKKRKRIRL